MGVPDFQTLMLPLVRLTADGADHRIADLADAMADVFQLSEADRDERAREAARRRTRGER